MADRQSEEILIEASPATIMGIITDFEAYPDWIDNIKDAEIRETDDDGNARLVWYRVDARVMEIEYVLAYEQPDEHTLTWTLEEGDQINELDGEYLLQPEDSATRVRYSLEVDIAFPVPGFMKKRAAKQIMETGLKDLKRRAEATD